MICEINGDILCSRAAALVNPVNTKGVMGAGLAQQVKRLYPDMVAGYKDACDRHALRIGSVWTYPTGHPRRRYIICLPTKRHWRDVAKIEDIHKGLSALRDEIERLNLSSVAIPALGCGLGKLPWEPIRTMIRTVLAGLDSVAIDLYAPRLARATEGGTRP